MGLGAGTPCPTDIKGRGGIWCRLLRDSTFCFSKVNRARAVLGRHSDYVRLDMGVCHILLFLVLFVFSFSVLGVRLGRVDENRLSCWCFFSGFDYALAEEIVPPVEIDDLSDLPSGEDLLAHRKKTKRDRTNIVFDIYDEPDEALWRRYEGYLQRKERRGDERPLVEVFGGANLTQNQFGFYGGGVTGALDNHINLKGLRLKALYGQSHYKYRTGYDVARLRADMDIAGKSEFFEALIGYEFRFQGSIFKAYTGLVHEKRSFDRNQVDAQINLFANQFRNTHSASEIERLKSAYKALVLKDHSGSKTGAKFALEAWREFDKGHWFSGYGTYSTGNEFYSLHGRYGIPALPFIDVGIEFGGFGNRYYDAIRLGAFTRLKQGDGEWTVSTGVSGDYDRPDSYYVSVQYFSKLYFSDIFVSSYNGY